MKKRHRRRTAAFAVILAAAIWGCGGSNSGGPPPPSNVSVSVSPPSTTVTTGASQQLFATVTGTTNTAVTWNVNGVAGGNSTVGTVDATGLYTAPASVPNPPTVSVTAVSQADPSKSGSVSVTVVKPGTGAINQAPQSLPIELGTSGGNDKDSTTSGGRITCCSGTLGALVTRGGNAFILSNNHVLARRDQAATGEDVTQPGLVDTHCSAGQVVAHLSQTAPLRTSNVDAALAAIVPGAVDLGGGILEFASDGTHAAPPANSLAAAAVNLPVAKSGRSTGLTCSTIQAVNATVRVDYQDGCGSGNQFTVTFVNQIVVNGGSFSASGDSGSLIVNAQTSQPVALLFAGASTNTIGDPIQDVLQALKDPNTGEAPVLVGAGQHALTCPSSIASPAPASAVAESRLAAATAAKDKYANSLMADAAVLGVGAGASNDLPGEAALVIYLERDKPHSAIPAQLDGVRTKIVLTDRFRAQGAEASAEEAARAGQILSAAEISRATQIKERHTHEMMANPEIFGIGVGASSDSPGEAAVVVYVDRVTSSAAVPAEIEGVRTRVVRTDRFRAFGWNEKAPSACGLRRAGAHPHTRGRRAAALKTSH